VELDLALPKDRLEVLEKVFMVEPLLPVGVLEPKAPLPLPILFCEESRYLVPPVVGDLIGDTEPYLDIDLLVDLFMVD